MRGQVARTPIAATAGLLLMPMLMLLLLALTGAASAAPADELAAGRAKAQACALCHGADGISTQPDAPHLAGQPAIYLTAQLKAFRSGERRHEVMNLMAKPLADADIDKLAAWFAAIRIEAKPPP